MMKQTQDDETNFKFGIKLTTSDLGFVAQEWW